MNRRKSFRVSIALLLVFVLFLSILTPSGLGGQPMVASAATTELIANGGFENEMEGWNTGGNSKFSVSDTVYRSGSHSLQVDGPQDWNGVKYTVAVLPSTEYTLTFYGKGGGGAAYKVLDANEAAMTESYTGASDDWAKYTVSFNSGINSTIILYLSDAGQTAYYDDFVLERVLPNLLDNGGFENGLTGWNTGGNSKFTLSNSEFHSGSSGLQIDGPQAWNGIKYTATVRPNVDYTLTFYGKGGGGAAYKVLAGADEATITENYTGAHDGWFQYTVSFNSGANQSVIIYLSDAGQTAYYDDFYIGDPVLPDPQPVADNVVITGEAKVSKILTGSFTYSHPANIAQGYSMYQWLQSDTESGSYSSIIGAVGSTFIPTDAVIGKYIKLKVTPVDSQGLAGLPATSGAAGPILDSSSLEKQMFELNNLIGTSEQSLASSSAGTGYGQYPESARTSFGQAIAAAKSVAANPSSDEAGIQTAASALTLAAAAFDSARIKQASPFSRFITTAGTKLMDGNDEFRFISYNYPGALFNEDEGEGLVPTAFEQEDAIRTIALSGGRVFRTYSLTVRDKTDAPDAIRHIDGPGMLNEEAFVSMDKLLQLANQHQVRVIIPFIDNWDWPPGGITDFAHFRGKDRMEFYTDPQLIEDFKQVLNQVMNRVNSFTGVKYKDDPAILAWETGNELMVAPEWMTEIAAYYQSINPNQLLISGNQMELPHFYRNMSDAALADPNIDIVKSHYYSGNYASRVVEDKAQATAHGKPFIVGEFGFKSTQEISAMLDEVLNSGTSGAMVWSLRPHSYNGGFIRHSEYDPGDGIVYSSYHFPGFPSGDYQDETGMVNLIREQAYAIQGQSMPALPVPANAPEFIQTDSQLELRWRGSTGASSYTVERTQSLSGAWEVIGANVLDDVVPGAVMFSDTSAISGNSYYYRVKGVNSSGASGYSNVLGPITARFVLEDSLETTSKQYYATESSVVYRVPSTIRSFAVDASVDASAEGDFTFQLSADGINFTTVSPVKTGNAYVLSSVSIAGANQLKIDYPDASKNKGVLSRVTIEYTGDGQAMIPVKPLIQTGVLVDEMNDYSNVFNHSGNLSIEQGALTAASKYPQIGRIQTGVGSGEVLFPSAPAAHIIEDGEHYGGEGLLMEKAYALDAGSGKIDLSLDKSVKKAGEYAVKMDVQLDSNSSVGIKKSLAQASRSGFDTVQLWVKPEGDARDLTIKLETTDHQVWSSHVTVSGSEAATLNLPITSFLPEDSSGSTGILNRDEILYFSLCVNSGGEPAAGTLYVDDIRFVQTRIIDTFDSYTDVSAFNARYGNRNTGGGAITGTLNDAFKANGLYSMQLDYDLAGPGYAGLITQLPNVDWSPYDTVSMWVKPGESDVKFTVQVKMGSNQVMEATVTLTGGAPAGVIEIPFADFDYPSWYGGSGTLNPKEITEFNIYFGQEGSSTNGTIYVDQIELVNKAGSNRTAGAVEISDSNDVRTLAASSAPIEAQPIIIDESRLVRAGSGDAYLLYRSLGDMNGFKLETYYAAEPTANEQFTFYGSSNGVDYVPLNASGNYLGGEWHKVNYELQDVPEGIKVLKIVYPETSNISPSQPQPTPGGGSAPGAGSAHGISNGEIVSEAIPNASGQAAVAIDAKDVQAALQQTKSNVLAISIKPATGTKGVTVKLPVQDVAASATINTVKVDTGLAVVTIAQSLLKRSNGTSPSDLELSVTEVDVQTLPERVRSQLDGQVVYDFNLSINGQKVSDFKGNEVTVSLPYKLKPNENPKKVVIYFLNDNGTLEVVKNGKYNPETGMVDFKAKHFSKYAASFVNVSFTDTGSAAWAVENIEALAARGIVEGVGNGRFDPSGKVTRAAFVQMLMNALELVDESAVSTFTDVAKEAWYADAIASAEKLGIVNGMADGTFDIHGQITRQDMAVMMFRASEILKLDLKREAVDTSFTDMGQISGYARSAVSTMGHAGILYGLADGSFAPKGLATRAEAATMIYRVFEQQ